ncbi:hypothetical protein [Halovenus sp. HT40]|uniref:hypothetical protein n=1 Tax=Halovenus sp. HT40 TaxID=3126691 RepID=UPI00300EFE2F
MREQNQRSASGSSTYLPALDPGITLLEHSSATDTVIHALAVDHLLLSGGDAVWIDPGTHAQTAPLTEVAPSNRILDRIRVARGFTPFQHLDLLRSLPDLCSDDTSLVVVPEIDRYYRDESLFADEGKEMLLSGIASLATIARESDVPVLLTQTAEDTFSDPIRTAADQHLVCEQTPFGPRFQTPNDETLVYPGEGGRWVQTTLSFWADILAAREPLYDQPLEDPTGTREVSSCGAN